MRFDVLCRPADKPSMTDKKALAPLLWGYIWGYIAVMILQHIEVLTLAAGYESLSPVAASRGR